MFRLRHHRHSRYLPTIIYGILACIFLGAAALAAQDNAIDLTRIPLGDSKESAEPQIGYIFRCPSRESGIGGAFQDGPWINGDGTWNRLAKITVDGAVEWSNYIFSIEAVGDERVLTGNGLPDHTTGIYPVQSTDDAYQYDRNPNSITEQTLTLTVPANPQIADTTSCAGGVVGIMLNGVPLFNGFDAEGRDAVAHEVQDECGGHPEVTGQYHYHDLTNCIEERTEGDTHSELVAYALDGFGIYGFRGEGGELLTNEDLDECHGHTHEIEWDGQIVSMYHYHATTEFPYSVGCFRGTPLGGGFAQDGGNQPPGSGNGNGQQPPPPGEQPPAGDNNPPPPPGGNNPPPPPGG